MKGCLDEGNEPTTTLVVTVLQKTSDWHLDDVRLCLGPIG
jgi:hypothetical protein